MPRLDREVRGNEGQSRMQIHRARKREALRPDFNVSLGLTGKSVESASGRELMGSLTQRARSWQRDSTSCLWITSPTQVGWSRPTAPGERACGIYS
jgi:hypothetical protein